MSILQYYEGVDGNACISWNNKGDRICVCASPKHTGKYNVKLINCNGTVCERCCEIMKSFDSFWYSLFA